MTAWKPDLMLATEHRDPHVSHCKKKSLVSFCNNVSGDLQVWQVTYSSAKEQMLSEANKVCELLVMLFYVMVYKEKLAI